MILKLYDYGLAVIVAAVIVFCFWFAKRETRELEPIVSGVDGESYGVLDRYQDRAQAADLLAAVNANIMKVLEHLKAKYLINNVGARAQYKFRLIDIAHRALTGYNFEVIEENDPLFGTGTAYTVDKGHKLVFCVRDKRTHQLHSERLLTFIALHELSHVGNATFGHNVDFWETFKFILHEAQLAGVYEPVDFAANNDVYCGLVIDHNPYFDSRIKQIW